MAVSPFLPRTGVPYIPRPTLGILVVNGGTGLLDVVISNITPNRKAGRVTMRVFDADGHRVYDDSHPYAIDDSSTAFIIPGELTSEHRLEVLTNDGQRGVALVAPPPPPVLTSINPTSVVEGSNVFVSLNGTGFRSDDVVKLNGNPIGANYESPTNTVMVFNGEVGEGSYPVTVTSAAGETSAAQTLTVTVAAALSAAPTPEPMPKTNKTRTSK